MCSGKMNKQNNFLREMVVPGICALFTLGIVLYGIVFYMIFLEL